MIKAYIYNQIGGYFPLSSFSQKTLETYKAQLWINLNKLMEYVATNSW